MHNKDIIFFLNLCSNFLIILQPNNFKIYKRELVTAQVSFANNVVNDLGFYFLQSKREYKEFKTDLVLSKRKQ